MRIFVSLMIYFVKLTPVKSQFTTTGKYNRVIFGIHQQTLQPIVFIQTRYSPDSQYAGGWQAPAALLRAGLTPLYRHPAP